MTANVFNLEDMQTKAPKQIRTNEEESDCALVYEVNMYALKTANAFHPVVNNVRMVVFSC